MPPSFGEPDFPILLEPFAVIEIYGIVTRGTRNPGSDARRERA
mgnify:CR=1